MIVGELAVGTLRDRATVRDALAALATATCAEHAEVLRFVDRHGLHGRGLSWVDAHLLAGTLLTPESVLWTRERPLRGAAHALGVAHPER